MNKLFIIILLVVAIHVRFMGANSLLGKNRTKRQSILDYSPQLEKIISGPLDTSLIVQENDIKYFIYTKQINGLQITRSNISRIGLDFSKHNIFVIHGWLESHLTDMEQTIKNAYLQRRDVNIFAVDWSSFSRRNYRTSKEYVPKVGKFVAAFIKFLERYVGLRVEQLGLVGHSLGAHLAGNVGRMLDGRPNWLMGLDPAGPLYYHTRDEEKLSVGDAQFVQVIHTGAGLLGYNGKLGDADYWVNGGTSNQPGCGIVSQGAQVICILCAHIRAYQYYSETLLTGGFRSIQCSSFVAFVAGSCKNNPQAYMGDDAYDRSIGDFYLYTNGIPPYGQF